MERRSERFFVTFVNRPIPFTYIPPTGNERGRKPIAMYVIVGHSRRLHQSKACQKSPRGVANLGLQTCMQPDVLQHTPASTTCMLIYANRRVGDFYCRFEVRMNATAVVSLVKRILFLLFWEQRRNRQRALRDLTCSFGGLVATIGEAYQCMAVKAAVRCLLLTVNAADNEHHALARSLSMFETSTQKTDRRHPTPFPNINEVECMPATSLHDLLQ